MDINQTPAISSSGVEPPSVVNNFSPPAPMADDSSLIAIVSSQITATQPVLAEAPLPIKKAPVVEPTVPDASLDRKENSQSILVIDVGGTKVKILAATHHEPRKASSGKDFTPARLVETVRKLAVGWDYDCISLGYPGLVGPQGPRSEPGNLGPGWVGFDYTAAFGKPVKIINDAAMQALGSYEGGRMLFLGLGTGVGSALITGHVIVPLELGSLMYDGERTVNQMLGRRGFARLGKNVWREAVNQTVTVLMRAFVADYVVVGGGNSKNVKGLPPGGRRGHNLTAFRGGFRLWSLEDVWVLAAPGGSTAPAAQDEMRVL